MLGGAEAQLLSEIAKQDSPSPLSAHHLQSPNMVSRKQVINRRAHLAPVR
jgi:hypothetical protein